MNAEQLQAMIDQSRRECMRCGCGCSTGFITNIYDDALRPLEPEGEPR